LPGRPVGRAGADERLPLRRSDPRRPLVGAEGHGTPPIGRPGAGVTHTDEVEVAVEQRSLLGEGPTWDRNHDALVWVDILEGLVHLWPTSGLPRTFGVDTHVGAALPALGGGWLLAV